MEIYWQCKNCGSVHVYPAETECDVCDYKLSPDEEKQLKHNNLMGRINNARTNITDNTNKVKQNYKKILDSYIAKTDEKEHRRKSLLSVYSEKYFNAKKKEERFFKYYKKSIKTFASLMICLTIASVVTVGIALVKQDERYDNYNVQMEKYVGQSDWWRVNMMFTFYDAADRFSDNPYLFNHSIKENTENTDEKNDDSENNEQIEENGDNENNEQLEENELMDDNKYSSMYNFSDTEKVQFVPAQRLKNRIAYIKENISSNKNIKKLIKELGW